MERARKRYSRSKVGTNEIKKKMQFDRTSFIDPVFLVTAAFRFVFVIVFTLSSQFLFQSFNFYNMLGSWITCKVID